MIYAYSGTIKTENKKKKVNVISEFWQKLSDQISSNV